jgi:hypothetical protein
MSSSVPSRPESGNRFTSPESVDVVFDCVGNPTAGGPPSEAELRFLEAERERYLRGLAYREMHKESKKDESSQG